MQRGEGFGHACSSSSLSGRGTLPRATPRRCVGIDLGVDQTGRVVAGGAPRSQSLERGQVLDRADHDALGADGPGHRGEVGVGELRQVDRVAHAARSGAPRRRRPRRRRPRSASASFSRAAVSSSAQRHDRAAVAERGDAQPVRPGDGGADRARPARGRPTGRRSGRRSRARPAPTRYIDGIAQEVARVGRRPCARPGAGRRARSSSVRGSMNSSVLLVDEELVAPAARGDHRRELGRARAGRAPRPRRRARRVSARRPAPRRRRRPGRSACRRPGRERVDVDLDDPGVGAEQLAVPHRPAVQAGAEGDDEVGLRGQLLADRRGEAAGDAERERQAVRTGRGPSPRREQRAGALAERLERLAGRPATRPRRGRPGSAPGAGVASSSATASTSSGSGARRGRGDAPAPAWPRAPPAPAGRSGRCSTTGSRSTRARRSARAASSAAVAGLVDAVDDRPAAERDRRLVELEVRPQRRRRRVGGQQDRRRPGLRGLDQAGERVGESGALVRGADGDPAGGPPVAVGHAHGVALVARGVNVAPRLAQGVRQQEVAAAEHPEGGPTPPWYSVRATACATFTTGLAGGRASDPGRRAWRGRRGVSGSVVRSRVAWAAGQPRPRTPEEEPHGARRGRPSPPDGARLQRPAAAGRHRRPARARRAPGAVRRLLAGLGVPRPRRSRRPRPLLGHHQRERLHVSGGAARGAARDRHAVQQVGLPRPVRRARQGPFQDRSEATGRRPTGTSTPAWRHC